MATSFPGRNTARGSTTSGKGRLNQSGFFWNLMQLTRIWLTPFDPSLKVDLSERFSSMVRAVAAQHDRQRNDGYH